MSDDLAVLEDRLQTRETFPLAPSPLGTVQIQDELGLSYLEGDIDFGAIGSHEILQNIKFIILTDYYSVPLDREFGMDYSMVDKPMRIAEAILAQEVAMKISLYEPRAQFREINYLEDMLNGKLSPSVRVALLTTNELPKSIPPAGITAVNLPAPTIATAFDFPQFYEWLLGLAKLPGPAGPIGPEGPEGPIGEEGPIGPTGEQGENAFTIISANFDVPAIGASVVVTVADASWIVIGQMVVVETAGGAPTNAYSLKVTAKTGNQVTLLNPVTSAAGTGDMTKAVYDTDNDSIVDHAELADAAPWTGITSKPSTFPPDATAELVARKAQANGYASLDGTGKVPTAQLPAFGIGDVVGPGTSVANEIAIYSNTTGKLIGRLTPPAGVLVGTTATQTLTGKTLTSPVINSPTGLVKADVGLGSVDNTSDANKPVSTAQAAADALKEDKANKAVANGYASLDATTKVPAAQLPTAPLNPAFVSLTDAATVTWTVSATQVTQNATVTIAGNRILAFSGIANGMNGTLKVIQGTGGSRTLTLPTGSKVINAGAGAIALSTAVGAIDLLTWIYDGTNYFWTFGKNYT